MLSHNVNYLPFICDCEYNYQLPPARGTLYGRSGNLYDRSTLKYFPASNVWKPNNDRFDIYLDVEDYMPEDIRVKIVDGFVVIKGRNEKRVEGGWIEQQFSRRCPLPPGLKAEGLLSNYLANGTLNITAALVKCDEGGVEKIEGKEPAVKMSDIPKAKTNDKKVLTCALQVENALDQTVKNFEKGIVLTTSE